MTSPTFARTFSIVIQIPKTTHKVSAANCFLLQVKSLAEEGSSVAGDTQRVVLTICVTRENGLANAGDVTHVQILSRNLQVTTTTTALKFQSQPARPSGTDMREAK